MTRPHRPPPLETLRDAIAEALWGAVSAPSLPAACVALGLRDGNWAEAMHSKRKYVRSRITTLKSPELLALAQRVIEESCNYRSGIEAGGRGENHESGGVT
jgi:hypothetical protein